MRTANWHTAGWGSMVTAPRWRVPTSPPCASLGLDMPGSSVWLVTVSQRRAPPIGRPAAASAARASRITLQRTLAESLASDPLGSPLHTVTCGDMRLHAVTASTTYCHSLYCIRPQPLLHTVTASTAYVHSLYYIQSQPLLHTMTAPTTYGDMSSSRACGQIHYRYMTVTSPSHSLHMTVT